MKTDYIKIRLTKDLTQYNPIMTLGAEGVTLPKTPWQLDCDTFCRFSNGYTAKIYPNSYEIIDEEYLAQEADEKEEKKRIYLNATVVERQNKHGAFLGLKVDYVADGGYGVHRLIKTRAEIKEIEEICREAGRTIRNTNNKNYAALKGAVFLWQGIIFTYK